MKFILTAYAIFIVIKLARFGLRKIYNPALTGAALDEYISHTVRTRDFHEFDGKLEEDFTFHGLVLFASFTGYPVEELGSGFMVEFRIYPNETGIMARPAVTFLFIRSEEHLKLMKEKMEMLERARREMESSVKAGFAPYEEEILMRKVAGITGRLVLASPPPERTA